MENTNNTNQTNNENNSEKEVTLKKGFFKKVWYSIFKLEKYGEMSAEGVTRAVTYLIKLSLIIAIVVSLGTLYQINGMVKKGIKFLDEQVGEFSYQDGVLQLENKEVVRAPSSMFGEVIIDTNEKTTEEINQYLNSIKTNKGILILKDKVIIKGMSSSGTLSYNYKTTLTEANITQLDKNKAIEYVSGNNIWKIYAIVFVLLLGYSLINAFLPLLFDAFLLSLFGYIATWFAKIRIRFAAIFNLAAYSLTLSVFLHAVYITLNVFTDFTIKYFQIMYVAVAAIYLIAAIFLIKSEFIKKQMELTKEIQKKNDEDRQKELEKQEENKEEKPEEPKKEDKPKDKKEKKEEKGTNGAEPEGV
ncbi:MAG: DUF1189 domain-containing protein [Clostridia bacterium]|nr:DUF1189 domain-containing protein [Clostridia bacterium]